MTSDITLLYFLNSIAGIYAPVDMLIIFLASYSQYVMIAVFFIFLYGAAYLRKQKWNILITVLISSIIARFGITELIRFLYHRPRPFVGHQLYQLILTNEWSFPSGHSAFFFAMAMAIYCYNKKWGIYFFVTAFLMNISRVIAGIHYPSDIAGGMIIGVIVAYIVFTITEKKKIYNHKSPFVEKGT